MTLESPLWMDADFFKKVLREYYKDESISVDDLLIKPATDKGDNYSSKMYRVMVEYTKNRGGGETNEKISLIVKVAPETGPLSEMIKEIGIFDIEISMMSDTLMRMTQLLGSDASLSARVLYTQLEHPGFIVCEDLASLGFRMANRQTGLDLPHALLAIRSIAKFHASSVALWEKDPDSVERYDKPMFHKDYPEKLADFFITSMKNLAEEVASWPELGPKYSEKIMKLSAVAYQKGIKAVEFKKDDFHVINHGDFWVNNMLFRYDDKGNPIGHIFVDFQISVYNSPAIDILYFLNTSYSNEAQLDNHELLLQEYISSLASTMARLNCETPALSLEELKKAMRDREFYGAISSFSVLPLVLVDKSKVTSIDEMLEKPEAFKNPAYQGEAYRKVMLQRLPYYDKRGLLDV